MITLLSYMISGFIIAALGMWIFNNKLVLWVGIITGSTCATALIIWLLVIYLRQVMGW